MARPKLYVDSKGRSPGKRRKLIWCEKHKQVGANCKSKKCRKQHPGL